MFWLNNEVFIFYQIFTKFTYNDEIYCYLKDNINIKNYKCEYLKYSIIIKNNIIKYTNTNTNVTKLYVIKKSEFCHNANKFPTHKYYYEKNNILLLPNTCNDQYDYVYNNIEFKIYTISDNIFYVIETNGNNEKSYFIVDNNNIDKFYDILPSLY